MADISKNRPKQKSLLQELGWLTAVLSVSDLSVSGIIVGVISFLDPNPISGLGVMWAVFITTFPLTIAVGIIVFRHKKGVFDLVGASVTIIVAALISDLLNLGTHLMVLQASSVPKGPTNFIYFAASILAIYWSRFGPLLFLKAIVLGWYFGAKLKELSL